MYTENFRTSQGLKYLYIINNQLMDISKEYKSNGHCYGLTFFKDKYNKYNKYLTFADDEN
jgi:hypothetical protein